MAEKSKGLGDTIKKATSALGIKQCEPCKKRQQKLNKLFPYKSARHEAEHVAQKKALEESKK